MPSLNYFYPYRIKSPAIQKPMKGQKRLIEIDELLDDLDEDFDAGVISQEEYDREFTPLRKERALILYNDAKKELAEIELEIKQIERDLETVTNDGLVIMAKHGVKKLEKLVESIIKIMKMAVKRFKKARTDYLRVMKDESKYL